ncbi:MAG: hypothetical protein PHQ05_04745 [Sterolibacterium sp.]|nr:hypothetical protein [Sterolibacterium sp.]
MALSIWGAITGTIGTVVGLFGLWLRFRQHGLDKAGLSCESDFGFESPTRNQHKIIIRSTGRRPVTVDAIRYFIVPQGTWHNFFRKWQHRKGRWIKVQHLQPKVNLTEGEKTEVPIQLNSEGLNIQEIYKAEVIDQTGRHWEVKWPSLSKLCIIATTEQMGSFENQNESRICSAIGYRLGEKFYLETKFNTIPGRPGVAWGRSFWLPDLQTYHDKYKDVEQNQCVRFLAAKIDEIT